MKIIISLAARLAVVLPLLFIAVASAFGQTDLLDRDLGKSFKKFDIVRVGEGSNLRTDGQEKNLTFAAAGRSFDLAIKPYEVRSARYRAENATADGDVLMTRGGVNTYKGTIAGTDKSQVRLSIKNEEVEGYFETAGERFFIEPASKYSRAAAKGDSIVYKAEDSLLQLDGFECGTDVVSKIESGMATANGQLSAAAMAFRTIEIATEADLEYVNTLGGAAQANNEILAIINMVEGVYENELNLTFRVVYQHTWSTPDGFDGTSTSTLLTSFLNYWNTNYPTTSIPRDAAHLFSGKPSALSRGIAYLGVICRNPSLSYGLSGYLNWAPGKFLIPAHELGHNLGANHAEGAQSCANTLMNATLSGSTPLSFCTFSRGEINAYVGNNNGCLSTSSATAFDFDGDGLADQSVFRPSTGYWYLSRGSGGFNAFAFGQNGDKAVSADFDGDGISDAAVYRGGLWYYMRSSNGTFGGVNFGLASDVPVPADLNGDGKAEVTVFRPSTGEWYWISSIDGAFAGTRFGLNGDVPLPADYDGDGRADINVFRPSSGTWYRLNSSNGSFFAQGFGLNGDKAVTGDFDGDARADLAVWRPSSGVWYYQRSTNNTVYAAAFGLPADLPVPADYDGDGKADISVYRPSDGIWYRINSGNGQYTGIRFGLATDNPIPAYYVR